MPPTLTEMLKVAQGHDNNIHARHVKINKAIQEAGVIAVTSAVPVHELKLHDEDADPFNGNVNNRRVAARIARDMPRKSANHSEHFIIGNPDKAAQDVARSLAVNPDPVIPSGDVLPDIQLAPTPGSPAAQRKAKDKQKPKNASPAAPPTWTQNADTDSSS